MVPIFWRSVVCWLALLATVDAANTRPNVLWISCEDISPHLGCYGDPHAITPHLDELAAQGIRYTNAFTAAGVCAPNRSSIITGMFQNSIGTHHMRCNATLPSWLKPFPVLMKEAGYFCTNNSKTDYQFSRPSARQIWNESGRKAHWKNRPDGKPFFSVFNFTGCHESGIASKDKYRSVTKDLTKEQRQDPEALSTLPPYYPDTPITREDWKRNYELITAMDAWAGGLIEELKESGEYENTIIFFWSDHGVGLPRAKRWLYDSGTHIPLIVRIPNSMQDRIQPAEGLGAATSKGLVDPQLICSVDFGPTVLNVAGIEVPEYVQGQPFLGPNLPEQRSYVYGARDRMDERYDIIRTVRDQRFRYVRNFEPLKPYYQYMNTPEKGATMKEIRRAERNDQLSEVMSLFSAKTKPAEELYDLDADPHEVNNLADDERYFTKLEEMRSALAQWQRDIGDVGLIPEAEIEIEEKRAGSRYEILHSRADNQSLLERLVRVATKASSGVEELPTLMEGLKDREAAVRYWSATGIGNLGREALATKSGPDVEPMIRQALEDSSPSVRIAAARAMASFGEVETALGVLEMELASEHPWGRLAAAIVLDEMDNDAEPSIPALRQALVDQPNKYIVRVANRALNELQGTNNQVP